MVFAGGSEFLLLFLLTVITADLVQNVSQVKEIRVRDLGILFNRISQVLPLKHWRLGSTA